jgi:predicted nucleic acid-binding protein
MTYLLDTNVVSELRKPAHRIDPNVRRWAVSQLVSELMISVITVMELEIGVLRAERRDPDQGRLLRQWLERNVFAGFAGRILAIDTRVSRRAAAMHVPDPGPERDTLIAATAAEHTLTVATRNVDDFAASGVPTINPWQA